MKPPSSIHKSKAINELKNSDLTINISKLSEGIHKYHLHTESSNLALDERFHDDVDIDVVLDKTSTQILLKTEIDTDGNFECDRCLTTFSRHIHTAYTLMYLYQAQEFEIENEIQVINRDTVFIDLAEDVRQYILLAIPIKLLCKEDCKGLCPSCGKNLNEGKCNCNTDFIDPRWEALSKLIKNKNK
ncbi:MAG: hypothetical protein IGBAC_1082 [Ignavibacteriae bacterium]|nr:MAG: hypothetical protein IGBAC_1082 [Ignavibacteriota bacterium]